jgi:hypothetical protein
MRQLFLFVCLLLLSINCFANASGGIIWRGTDRNGTRPVQIQVGAYDCPQRFISLLEAKGFSPISDDFLHPDTHEELTRLLIMDVPRNQLNSTWARIRQAGFPGEVIIENNGKPPSGQRIPPRAPTPPARPQQRNASANIPAAKKMDDGQFAVEGPGAKSNTELLCRTWQVVSGPSNTEGLLFRFLDDKVFYITRPDGHKSGLIYWDWQDEKQEVIKFTHDNNWDNYGRKLIRVLNEDTLELTVFSPEDGFVDWKLERHMASPGKP